MSPLLHPALSTSLSKSFGLNSPFSLAAMSTSLKDMSSSPGFSSMGMSLGRSFEERPKIEAQFFKNFTCCGLDLHDLHGLLEHFEECHVAYDDDDDEDASLEGDDVAARMDDMDAEIESEGTISGPPSPRLMGNGQVPRFETKKSNLSSAFEAPDSPASPALHLDGGMELDMEMGDDDDDHHHHHHHHGPHSSAPTSSAGSASQQSGSAAAASISAFDPLHGSASKKRSSPPAAAFPPNPSAGGVQLPPLGGGGSRSRSASAQATDKPNDKAREEAEALSYLNPAAVNSPIGGVTNNAPLPPSFLFNSSPNKTSPSSSNQAQDPSQASTSAHHDFDFDDGIEAVQETDSEAEEEEENNAVAHNLVNGGENSFAFGGANATTTTLGAGQALPSLPAHPDHSAIATLGSSNSLAAALQPLGQQGVHISPSSSGRPYTPPSEKPFKCTVPGCDKSYKQQNGLKYHRLHGHCGSGSGLGGGAGVPTSQQVAPPVATAVEVSGEVPNSSSSGGERFSEGKPFVCHVASCGKRYKKYVSLAEHSLI